MWTISERFRNVFGTILERFLGGSGSSCGKILEVALGPSSWNAQMNCFLLLRDRLSKNPHRKSERTSTNHPTASEKPDIQGTTRRSRAEALEARAEASVCFFLGGNLGKINPKRNRFGWELPPNGAEGGHVHCNTTCVAKACRKEVEVKRGMTSHHASETTMP